MGSPKHGTSGSTREGLALVQQGSQNTAINLLCADATKTQIASSRVAQARQKAKRGRAPSIAASGPALPDPTPPVSEAVIDNIADRVLARIEERLALRLMPPKAQPPPPTAVLPNLAAHAGTTGACSPERSGQCTHDRSVTTSHWASAKGADRDSALHVTGTCARSVPLAR